MRVDVAHRIVRILLITVPLIVLVMLAWQHFAFSGTLQIVNDFSRPSPFIKGLWPPGRVEEIRYDAASYDYVQAILVDPVTFRVQLPRVFDAMTVTVRYAKSDDQPFRLGIRTKPEVWAWELRDFSPMRDDSGWLNGSVRFDDLKKYAGEGRVVDILLNAPNLQNGTPIVLTEIRVVAERESLTLSNVWRRSWRFITYND